MNKIKFEKVKTAKFELVLQVRDNAGNPTGKTKSFVTDSPEELDRYFERNSGMKKVKNKKKKDVEVKKQEEVAAEK